MKLCYRVSGVLLLLYVGSACASNPNDDAQLPGNGYQLDSTTREVAQTIDPDIAEPQHKKFVKIEVVTVVNPRNIPLSFEVHYQPVQGKPFLLGTFSLFPPDNPGDFIVATEGKLQTGGVIIVSLMPLTKSKDLPDIHVRIKPISLLSH